MILRPKTLITLLILTIILLAGCSGCAQKKITRETEIQAKKPVGLTSKQGVGPQRSDALPTTFYPPENPYEDITINGEAPPFAYYGNPIYWIPSLQYETKGPPGGEETYPTLPNKMDELYIQEYRKLSKESGESLTLEQLYTIQKMKTKDLSLTEAAMYWIHSSTAKRLAQDALDENPNDYHTLLIWSEAQGIDHQNKEKGYRQLLQMRPNAAYVLYRLGQILKFKNKKESIQLLKKAVQYAPNTRLGARAEHGGHSDIHIRDSALNELAHAYFLDKEKQKAVETLNYLQQITTNEKTRQLTQERIGNIQRENYFSRKFYNVERDTDNE